MTTRTTLTGVRVFDGEQLTPPRTVVIDGDVIGTDATGAREIDASGAVLLPGLIDAHVHLHGPETLRDLASWGVTTGLDMACWPRERVASLRGEVTGAADFRTPGMPAIGPGGRHADMPGMPAEAIVTTPAEARAHVEARAAEGDDYIKGVAEAPGDGGPSAETLQALVVAAREHGLKTVIHAATAGAYVLAVDTGAEFITHIPVNGPLPAETIDKMRAAGQIAVPTLTMMESVLAGRAPVTGPLNNVTALHRAGIEILAGTDANAQPGAPGLVPHGESLHREFELLARAGLSPVEILRAATVLPARAFGLPDRGAVEPGLRADLVLVDGDPTADLTATRAIRAIWCAGHSVTPVPHREDA
ncbi:amidohydrolase family protein [Amycolatopsis sp.]|uniref:amidohydrolase family protein n=1 Tax=Amycolatopsis sp. TaxID=37632 RepID=UPI002BC11DAF|nr:amidohydrolase family protein [Amycolatopsis sp.]HVV10638.1 amidohydrolase family protein [Amycolatopsis sp.]